MDLNLGLTLISIVSFILLLWIFNRYFFGPILNNVHMREHSIEKQLKDAQNAIDSATNNRELSLALLQKTQTDTQKMIEQAKEHAEKIRSDILEKAAKEAEEMVLRAEERIRQESRKAFSELKEEVASISLLAAEKIISRSITDIDQRRLVDDVINEKGSIHV